MELSRMDFRNESTSSTDNETTTPIPTPVSCRTQVEFGKDYQEFEYIMNVYITTALIAFGFIGNIVSFITLKYMKQATVVLLLRALAAADSFYLLTCLSFQTFRTLFAYDNFFSRRFWFYPYISVITWPIASMAQTCSVWLVVLVTFDRYEAICHAMETAKYMTKTKVKMYIALVFVGAICFNLPTAFDLRVVDRRPYCPNIKKVDTFATDFYQDPIYDLVYKTVMSFVFRVALPVLTVITLNLWMLCQIKKSEEYRLDMAGRVSSGIRSINTMIGIITLVYVICALPDLTYRILRAIKFYKRDFLMPWDKFAYFAQISNLFLTVNSSTNFLWYCLAGSKFRETLKLRMCGSLSGGPGGSSALLTLSTRRTTSSTQTRPGTPLILTNHGRPLSLPGTPQIRAAGNTLTFPVSVSLNSNQRTLSGYLKPSSTSANGCTLSASTPVMSASSSDVLISTSARSSRASTPKFGSMSVQFA